MTTTNIETILDVLSTAVEAIVPDVRPKTEFKRWRGDGAVESTKSPIRERAFQFRIGQSKTPRRLSSTTVQWHRCELLFIVGYNFSEPQQTNTFGLGIHRIVFADEKQLVNKLFIANSLSNVPNVLRLQYNGADEPGRTSRTYRFDIEWGETFS